ncbi:MAG TPA: tetratricopeptide repeat protein [Pirellulales bacterium]|jgi:tetratricopeptide (TPR) repeat protein|nr:tetratricopeptide repeat protein [Pirellulales bacterium]
MPKRAALAESAPAAMGRRRPPSDAFYASGVCALVLLAIGLIYGQTLGHERLAYDDCVFVYENPHVTPGLTNEGIWWAFTEGPFGEWYPLAPLSHMLDCQLFGLAPWGHHLTNVLLHAAASIALFLVGWRMTGELWPSALVAALFAVHPQHVESVAWVAERRDVLSGLFFMLTLAAWLGYVRHGRSLLRYLLVAALFSLGLMAKPMLVTLPALLLLLDFWPLGRWGLARDVPRWAQSIERPGTMRLLLEKLPLAALSVGDCLMTLRTHDAGGGPMPWSERIGNAAVSAVSYVAGLFYPVDLAAFYPIPPGGPPAWKVAGAIAVLTTLTVAAVMARRRCPYGFVGWFWFLGTLAPVLGLIKMGSIAMADRYMYLPGIGLYIALAWGAARMAAGWPQARWMVGGSAGLATTVLAVCAAFQTSYWRDNETLWRHALACTWANAKAEFGLADALARKGQIDEAIIYFRRAGQHPFDAAPLSNLGVILARMGKLDEAIAEYRKALAMEPNYVAAHINLGAALVRQKRLAEASEHFRRALEIAPRNVEARCGLGVVLSKMGMIDAAITEYRKALEIAPDFIGAHINLGLVLADHDQPESAAKHFRRATEINPRSVEAHCGLGHVLLRQERYADALEEFERAVAIDARNVAAQEGLASALLGQGKIAESIKHGQTALAIDPDFVRAHITLARALAAGGRPDEAAVHYRRALQLDPDNAMARRSIDELAGAER